MPKRQRVQTVKVPKTISISDHRKYRKQVLPKNDKLKKGLLKEGSYVVFNRGIKNIKKVTGRVRKFPDENGAFIYTDTGEYYARWCDIKIVYVKKGDFIPIEVDEDMLNIFNKALDEIKTLAQNSKRLDIVDSHNPVNYCIRSLMIKFNNYYFTINIENKSNCEIICESNFTRKSSPKIENGSIKLSTFLSRLRFLKKAEREDRKRLKQSGIDVLKTKKKNSKPTPKNIKK